MTMPEAPDVGRALGHWLTNFGKAILMTAAVTSVLGGVSWQIAKPYIEKLFTELYIEASGPMIEQITQIAEINKRILERLGRFDERNLLEFNGGPVLVPPFQVRPGQTIAILYSLKRTADCSTRIRVNFVSAFLQRVDGRLTYSIPAVRSRVSAEFGNVVIDVLIPEETEPGFYSYAPEAIPEKCDGYSAVAVPPSPFFEVLPRD